VPTRAPARTSPSRASRRSPSATPSPTRATRTALPRIVVEEPTIKMRFGVNTSPFAGKDGGKYLTSRQIRERLHREARKNPAVRVEPRRAPTVPGVRARRAGSWRCSSRRCAATSTSSRSATPRWSPRRSTAAARAARAGGRDVPDSYVGVVTERLGERKGIMVNMGNPGKGRARVEFEVPSRGAHRVPVEFLTSTRGTGLLNTEFKGWKEWGGADDAPHQRRDGLRPRGHDPLRALPPPAARRVLRRRGRARLRGHDRRGAQPPQRRRREHHPREEALQRAQPRQGRERRSIPRACSPSRRPWSGSTATSSSRSRPSTCACARPGAVDPPESVNRVIAARRRGASRSAGSGSAMCRSSPAKSRAIMRSARSRSKRSRTPPRYSIARLTPAWASPALAEAAQRPHERRHGEHAVGDQGERRLPLAAQVAGELIEVSRAARAGGCRPSSRTRRPCGVSSARWPLRSKSASPSASSSARTA
jgi:hypothetical protein